MVILLFALFSKTFEILKYGNVAIELNLGAVRKTGKDGFYPTIFDSYGKTNIQQSFMVLTAIQKTYLKRDQKMTPPSMAHEDVLTNLNPMIALALPSDIVDPSVRDIIFGKQLRRANECIIIESKKYGRLNLENAEVDSLVSKI